MCRDRMPSPPRARWGQAPCGSTAEPRARLHTAQPARLDCAAVSPACSDARLHVTASDCSSDRSSGGSSPRPPATPPRALERRASFVSPVKDIDPPASPFAGVRDEADADAAARLGRGQQSFMAALRARDQAARDQIAALAAARAAAALGRRRGSGGPKPGSPIRGPALLAGSGGTSGCAVLSRISAVLDATARTGAAVFPCLDRHRAPAAQLAARAQGPEAAALVQPRRAAALFSCLDRQVHPRADRQDAGARAARPAAAGRAAAAGRRAGGKALAHAGTLRSRARAQHRVPGRRLHWHAGRLFRRCGRDTGQRWRAPSSEASRHALLWRRGRRAGPGRRSQRGIRKPWWGGAP